jgi:phosphoribosylamine-glycine ligase
MLWITGKAFREFRTYLELHQISYGVFWDSTLQPPKSYASVPLIPLDFAHLNQSLKNLDNKQGSDITAVVVSGYENYVVPAAQIARHFNLPSMDMEVARAATDKLLMRQRFAAKAPQLTPDFSEVQSWEDVESFMTAHTYPVMLKPASLMKSLLITKNNSLEELQENYRQTVKAIDGIYHKYGVRQKPRIIIEEFLEGTMHTVAGFVNRAGQIALVPAIVDCRTAEELKLADSFIYSRHLPTRLPAEAQAAILAAAQEGVTALGVAHCPVHVEIMLTKHGPKIIEIGARIGGYRARMYEAALGMDLYAASIAVATDQVPDLATTTAGSCAVIELFPEHEGSFQHVTASQQLKELLSLKYFGIKAKPGQVIGKASQGYKAAAIIILAHASAEQLQADYDFIQQNCRVIAESN